MIAVKDDLIASDAMRLVGGNPASGEFCRGTAISVFGEFTAQGKVFVADLSALAIAIGKMTIKDRHNAI